MLKFASSHILSRLVYFAIITYLSNSAESEIVQKVSIAIGISGLFRYIINFSSEPFYLAHPSTEQAVSSVVLNLRIIAIALSFALAIQLFDFGTIYSDTISIALILGTNLAIVDYFYVAKTLLQKHSRSWIYILHVPIYLSLLFLLVPFAPKLSEVLFIAAATPFALYAFYLTTHIKPATEAKFSDVLDGSRMKVFLSSLPDAALVPLMTLLLAQSGQEAIVPSVLQVFSIAGLMSYPFTTTYLYFARLHRQKIHLAFSHRLAPYFVIATAAGLIGVFLGFLTLASGIAPQLVPSEHSLNLLAATQATGVVILQWVTFFLRMHRLTGILIATSWTFLFVGILFYFAFETVLQIAYLVMLGKLAVLAVYLGLINTRGAICGED